MRAPDERKRAAQLRDLFAREFGAAPEFVARAPGRINLIGEHTDYNGGFVLPAAIDRSVLVAARAVPGSRHVELFSANFGSRSSFSLDGITRAQDRKENWSNYVRAVAWALGERGLVELGSLPGSQMAIEGNVPVGSGLSSSAAIEVAAALCFTRLAGVSVEGAALALACQKAENDFIGVKSGIMDQFISALGQPNSALLIDTHSLDYRAVPLGLDQMGYKLVAVDSAVPRSLITSAYNTRKAECEQAVAILAPLLDLGEGAQLRDVSLEQLEAHREALPETLYRRARHVIGENARTLQFVALLEGRKSQVASRKSATDDLRPETLDLRHETSKIGELLYASHASLRDDYEVSSKELDLLVELARQSPGVMGARMTGAGFGGCTVNIVQADHLQEFEERTVEEYRRRTGLDGKMYVCEIVRGGSLMRDEG